MDLNPESGGLVGTRETRNGTPSQSLPPVGSLLQAGSGKTQATPGPAAEACIRATTSPSSQEKRALGNAADQQRV